MKFKNCFKNKCAVYSRWKESGLADLRNNDGSRPSITEAIDAYDNFIEKRNKNRSEVNKENGKNKKVIPSELELFMNDMIKYLALCGQGINTLVAQKLFNAALLDGMGKLSVSRDLLDKFCKKYNIQYFSKC